jgi:hypothetical protein
MDTPAAGFEAWGILDIYGHQRYAGFISTQTFGTAVMFRIDVPPLPERERVTKHYEYADVEADGATRRVMVPAGSRVKEPAVQGYTKLFGVGAIFGITPCTEDAAVAAVADMQPRRLQLVALPPDHALLAENAELVLGDDGCPVCHSLTTPCLCERADDDDGPGDGEEF